MARYKHYLYKRKSWLQTKHAPLNKAFAVALVCLIVLVFVFAFISSLREDPPPYEYDYPPTMLTVNKNNPQYTNVEPLPETLPPPPPPVKPVVYTNPLTGLECSKEVSTQRPAAIMMNNIAQAAPQDGISKADILYECLVEGGITRLVMLTTDYSKLDVIGSVRSSREYYLDFIQNHDAIYFHAGGSNKAYDEIDKRKIDSFDAVRMYLPDTFYRDEIRLETMGLEHSLVTTGNRIKNTIRMFGTRTTLKSDFVNPFVFPEDNEPIVPEGNEASCVKLTYSSYQEPYFKYDSRTNTYKRWQFGAPHIDRMTEDQLEFTNIIVILCYQSGALNSSGNIDVNCTGDGEGYYISNGKYIRIKWEKADGDTPIKLFNTDGSQLIINKGKTYMGIINKNNKAMINMNYVPA